MTGRGRGRPPAAGNTVSPERIVAEGLALLEQDGLEALTMRALATRVGINPMTIYHHFQDRDGLIKALADRVYGGVTAESTDGSQRSARALLRAYHARVLEYPGLTLAIFAAPRAFPDEARRITGELTALLLERRAAPEKALVWTHILIDYTHGAALAAARQPKEEPAQPADFQEGLDALLEACEAALAR